ncbi:hypothetical protein NA57DRAFT_76392 [Rhizodiscina lignyota]|uniref:DUF7707 domain-containing protein n=1 Tax=Rhizodiscina lignyota TaxID=1504668 RepID=A0A9P4M6R5_9PEZI|nr:hypothetical protein NA57DRAFT_76392 [Rhizodiscina lignyota]
MLARTLILAVSALASFSLAQSFANATDCCTLNPGSVTLQMRQSWCMAERNSCPQICGGQTSANDCDPNQLTYNCTCFGQTTPNISDYGQTLPSLQCQQWIIQCVNNHPNDLDGQTLCHSISCGSKNATAVEQQSSSSSSSAASSSTSAPSSSASGSASAATSAAPSSTGAAMAMHVGKEYGTGMVGAVLFALFGLAL